MTRMRRRRRFGACLAAVGAAMVIAPSAAAAANLTLTAPGSINHNSSYRVMANGQVGKKAYLIVVYQHHSCSKNYAANQRANAQSATGGSIIFKKVGKGVFDARSVTLSGGVKGSVRYCGYLYGVHQDLGGTPLAHDTARVVFT